MKAVVAAFNQEKALVGAFSVITNLRMELFQALILTLTLRFIHLKDISYCTRNHPVWPGQPAAKLQGTPLTDLTWWPTRTSPDPLVTSEEVD